MANTLICPLCRSLLQANGSVDFKAPALSHPVCPVCGYPEDIPSGFPVPYRWDSLTVLTYQKPIKTYEQLVKEKPTIAVTTMQLADSKNNQPIYPDKPIQYGLDQTANVFGDVTKQLTSGISNIVGQTVGGGIQGVVQGASQGFAQGAGLPLIIVGVLVLVLILGRK